MTTVLIAAKYSASERGWSLLDQAMFTVVPAPGAKPDIKGKYYESISLIRVITCFLWCSSAGEEISSIMSVNRNIHHLVFIYNVITFGVYFIIYLWIRVKFLLSSISMMNVLEIAFLIQISFLIMC